MEISEIVQNYEVARKKLYLFCHPTIKETGNSSRRPLCDSVAWYLKVQWTLARQHWKEKDDWKKYHLVCGEIFLAQINSALFEHRSPHEHYFWPCPSICEHGGGYFQQPCHRTLIISYWFTSTWQWVRCIPMASTVTRPHSGRDPS